MTLGQGQEMALTFNTHIPSLTQLVVCVYQLSGHRLLILSVKSTAFTFSYEKTLSFQRWPCRKIGQGQPRVIIWTNYDWAGVPDATYQVSWKSVHRFRRRRFLKGFYHIWAWWPSWSCDQQHVHGFSFPMYLKAYIQNLVKNGPVVS